VLLAIGMKIEQSKGNTSASPTRQLRSEIRARLDEIELFHLNSKLKRVSILCV